jgi:predicted ATPase/transcriptional regulator with GAF, ATPase, and Fis domain
MTAPAYDLLDVILRTPHQVVWRAVRSTDGLHVLAKEQTTAPGRAGLLQQEFDLARQLTLGSIPRPLEIVRLRDREMLVVEDRGHAPLSQRLSSSGLALDDFFRIAVGLCDALADLHSHDIVVGLVNPQSFLVGAAGEAQILDLSAVQRLPVDVRAMSALMLAQGSASYIAPEQTGRISRAVDHRADLYGLGVTLYHALAARLPFDTDDPVELVHAQIARMPRAPVAISPSVPEQLSRLVMRLLAKAAEDRYQSAQGVRHDLEVCWREWREKESIATFDLGRRDFSDRLLISQRLYGREAELVELTEAFEEALEGRPGLILVAGSAGIGKTSFINELCRPIVRERGYFISGKFDQVARNVPYGALVQAFRSLIRQVLADDETQLGVWRSQLTMVLGANGGVIGTVIPEIEFIIGKQPAPVPLGAVESQNRFRYVFRSFVETFARLDHPLVLFLDDLQWVDAATLELLHLILTDADARALLVIGAYRDNEVTDTHPLSAAVRRLQHDHARVRRLTLGPLDDSSLLAFLADSLRAEVADLAGLAALLRERTGSNPFFVIQFLRSLQHDRLLVLDRQRGHWTFRLDAISAASTTDNVVTLMTQRIQRLTAGAQDVLRLAACIGSAFRWETFLIASRLLPAAAEAGLAEALTAGLIRPAEHEYDPEPGGAARGGYAFIHDRVQQAAYALIPERERAGVHLGVGRQLLAECGAVVPDDRLFEIVNHLNLGRSLVTDASERRTLARLNLAAARKAKAATAYTAALDYLSAGIEACGDTERASDGDMLFPLHFEHAECLYLAGRFDDAERAHGPLYKRAASKRDRAAVHELRVTFFENRSRYAEAIASGREGLSLFGITFPDADAAIEAALQAELATIQHLLGDRPIGSLTALPEMGDRDVRTAMRLLTLMWAPVYISGHQRLTSLISAAMVRLSIQHGNTEDSAYGYVTHAITVGPVERRYAQAFEWGELALAVNEQFGDIKRRAKIHQQLHAHVTLWRRAFVECVQHAREAASIGLQAGDFAYAGYGAATESWPAFIASRDLSQFVRDYTPALAFLTRVNMSGFRDAQRVMLNWALALQGRTIDALSLSNEHLDENDFVRRYSATAPLFMTVLRCARLHLCVVFDEPVAGLEAVNRAREVTIPGTMWPVLEDFWSALVLAAAYQSATPEDQLQYASRIASVAQSLEELASNCPENFRCMSLLVAAEQAVIQGRDRAQFLLAYQEAIAYAASTANLQQEALASDLCARRLLAAGDDTASEYVIRACRAYDAWGAIAKVHQMRQRFPDLLADADAARSLSVADGHAASEPELAALDVRSVLKVAQAVASELELEALLRTLLTIAVENAGAERGVFFQARAGDMVPVIEAVAGNDAVDVRRTGSHEIDVSPLALGIVRYVRRTRQDVVIGDTSTDERFGGIARDGGSTQSVLCVPVAHQGRLSGILFLQHSLSGVFTPGRTEIVRVLAAQAAIALANAQLYEEMKSEVERRAAAEHALRDALGEVEALKNRLQAENVYLQEEIGTQHNFNEIVGRSPALLDALRRVERVAPTDSTVLILGETGCGKELFARAVHSRSRRNDRPLVKVNCGAIAPGLVESELFGHVKGAFTGAIDKRVGRFELANGGTIFLDEISELPLEAQVKLLRVLQEQEFEPVGSSRTMRVSVRVIAATNRNLEQAVRDGRFRADLLYRLNVFPVDIPPLRERATDLPLLVSFFLSRIARTLGKPLHGVTARSMAHLQEYAWPGNVRELQNVLERAAILAEGPIVNLESTLASGESKRADVTSRTLRVDNLDDVQRQHIVRVLKSTGGVVEGSKGAAVILGVHPNTLRSRMKKLGIRPSAGSN